MSELKPFPSYPKSDPQFYLSKNKKPGSPTIFFVHFYGGHQRALLRHIRMVNELGYDAFAFNMPEFAGFGLSFFYKGRFGAKHLFAHMIAFFLDQIPGKKIIFAFSNPSASAIEAIYDRRFQPDPDVVGLVCDSGPSGSFIKSAWNLAIKAKDQPILLGLFAFLWSLRLHRELKYQLRRFPSQFPVLSLMGGKDEIIPPWHTEQVFEPLKDHLKITSVIFKEAGHLDALKLFSQEYKKSFSDWLN